MVKTKKNPSMNEIVCENLFLSSECPTTIGMRGNTQGDITDTTPAENETKKLTFIFITQYFRASLTIDRQIYIHYAFLFLRHLNLK